MSELMYERGRIGVLAHKTQFNRREKDWLKADPNVEFHDPFFFFAIQEEPDDEVDALALASYEEFQEDGGEKQTEPVMPPNTPTIPDELEGLTVAQLKEIAETEEIDISDVKLKADIIGRIWGAREMRAEEQEG